jgi:hypothetical protein
MLSLPLITLLQPQQRADSAIVRTSSCRGYVVELYHESTGESALLRGPFGQVVHFRSLNDVQDALRRRGVKCAALYQQHACEEVSALGVSSREESGVPLL